MDRSQEGGIFHYKQAATANKSWKGRLFSGVKSAVWPADAGDKDPHWLFDTARIHIDNIRRYHKFGTCLAPMLKHSQYDRHLHMYFVHGEPRAGYVICDGYVSRIWSHGGGFLESMMFDAYDNGARQIMCYDTGLIERLRRVGLMEFDRRPYTGLVPLAIKDNPRPDVVYMTF